MTVRGARLIVGVVPRGQADRHVGAAIRAGAQAATVFVGRSTDAVEYIGASGLALRSEKEVVVTVVGVEVAEDVMRAMCAAGTAEPADEEQVSDFIVMLPVARVVGLLEAV